MNYDELKESFDSGRINDSILFENLFSPEALIESYREKFKQSPSKGIDRINGFQFAISAISNLSTSSRKCLNNSYRFSAYLENLKIKGRDKPPRLISIPTIRDRIILSQLNKFLSILYPERIPRNIASQYVREISSKLLVVDPEETWICSTDIKTFYDSIERNRLIKLLSKKIKCNYALNLIRHALSTPTVPKNTSRGAYGKYTTTEGIPQGLAISNILASIYMQPIDDCMTSFGVNYYRYVDDVLIFGPRQDVVKSYTSLKGRLKTRGLTLHAISSDKTHLEQFGSPFGYLGYYFQGKSITVRSSTLERFLQSIAAKFSDFSHNKSRRLEKFRYLNIEILKDIFMMELNERITGAINENKRYGWIAYFSQINDLPLLFKIDNIIRSLFERLPEFDYQAPSTLKSIVRSYWEMKYSPEAGYVRNYDNIKTLAEKVNFLTTRGRIDPTETLTPEQIENRYDSYVRRILYSMHADEGVIY